MILAFCIIITAVASALHGHGKIGKGYIMAAHALLLSAVAWSLVAGVAASAVYWLAFRRSAQAKAELTAMDNPSQDSFWAAAYAYLWPCAVMCLLGAAAYTVTHATSLIVGCILMTVAPFLAMASVAAFNYQTELGKKVGWNHGRFIDCRRMTEIITGAFIGGPTVWVVAVIVMGIYGGKL